MRSPGTRRKMAPTGICRLQGPMPPRSAYFSTNRLASAYRIGWETISSCSPTSLYSGDQCQKLVQFLSSLVHFVYSMYLWDQLVFRGTRKLHAPATHWWGRWELAVLFAICLRVCVCWSHVCCPAYESEGITLATRGCIKKVSSAVQTW